MTGRNKENTKTFYAYKRRKRVAKEKVGPLKDSGGNMFVEPDEVGEVLNKYFSSVFTMEKDAVDGKCRNTVIDIPGTAETKWVEVLEVFKNINVETQGQLMAIPEY